MSTQNLLLNAELSMAAYAELNENLALSAQIDVLEGQDFTSSQANNFADQYSIVTQFTDDETGFSATVFKDDDNNLTLAIRGTEPGTADLLFTDSLIAFNGAGYDQIVAMHNWWQGASAPAGTIESKGSVSIDFAP